MPFRQMKIRTSKVGCALLTVVVSLLPRAEFGPNHHREDAPHFIIGLCYEMIMNFKRT